MRDSASSKELSLTTIQWPKLPTTFFSALIARQTAIANGNLRIITNGMALMMVLTGQASKLTIWLPPHQVLSHCRMSSLISTIRFKLEMTTMILMMTMTTMMTMTMMTTMTTMLMKKLRLQSLATQLMMSMMLWKLEKEKDSTQDLVTDSEINYQFLTH